MKINKKNKRFVKGFDLERFEKMKLLRRKGLTLQEIGSIFSFSRERVRQLLMLTQKKVEELSIRKYCFFCGTECLKRYCEDCSKIFLKKRGREYTRMLVRTRDNFTCQDCGAVRRPEIAKKEGKRMFDVHHLNGLCGKKSRGYDSVEDLAAMVTLCHKCHFNRPEHNQRLTKV